MKKRKTKKKKFLKLRNRLSKIFRHLSWVRFEEPMPHHFHRESDDDEHTNWMRMF